MTALRQLGQVEHHLAPGKREEALASLTLMAQTGYDRHVIAVGRTLMSLVGADRSLERNETALRALSSLRLAPLENGMIKVSGQLDPEAGAVLTAALDPLSAPNPTDANGGRDPRPAERRRAEALIEICRRAAAAGGAAPTTSKAQIVVLIDLDPLTNAVRGAGRTLAGEVLSPETIRKLACDAAITPMILGSQSQPLDVGRTKRLVTPALLAALWARDKAAPSPAAGAHLNGATPTTSNTGLTADPPPCSTSHCSAPSITPTSTSATSPPVSPPSASPGRPDRSPRSRPLLPRLHAPRDRQAPHHRWAGDLGADRLHPHPLEDGAGLPRPTASLIEHGLIRLRPPDGQPHGRPAAGYTASQHPPTTCVHSVPMTVLGDAPNDACLICREHRGEVDVPGGLLDDGLVITFHRPPLDEPLVYAGHLLVTSKRHAADFAALKPR